MSARASLLTLRQLFEGFRYSFATEKDLQDGLEAALQQMGVEYRREHRLSSKDVVDFLVGRGSAVEVKVDGSLSGVTRQLHRYAQHQEVEGLLLVSSLRRLDRLPSTLSGKPVEVVVVGGGLA